MNKTPDTKAWLASWRPYGTCSAADRPYERLGLPLRAEATLRSLTQEILKSNEIEGEHLNKEQVRSSVARRLGIDIDALAPTDRNVEGVVEMMLDATQKYDEPLTKTRLYRWHAALFPTGYSGINKHRQRLEERLGRSVRIVSGLMVESVRTTKRRCAACQ